MRIRLVNKREIAVDGAHMRFAVFIESVGPDRRDQQHMAEYDDSYESGDEDCKRDIYKHRAAPLNTRSEPREWSMLTLRDSARNTIDLMETINDHYC